MKTWIRAKNPVSLETALRPCPCMGYHNREVSFRLALPREDSGIWCVGCLRDGGGCVGFIAALRSSVPPSPTSRAWAMRYPLTCLRDAADSTTALTIAETLSDLCKRDRTVAMTIHQPSTRVLDVFDKVLFLSQGRLVSGWRQVQESRRKNPCPHLLRALNGNPCRLLLYECAARVFFLESVEDVVHSCTQGAKLSGMFDLRRGGSTLSVVLVSYLIGHLVWSHTALPGSP